MRCEDPGHYFSLRVLDAGSGASEQTLTFVKRAGPGYPGNVGTYPGTTSQEVLRALIDRAEYVNNQERCAETEAAMHLMRSALLLLEIRAARKHGRTLPIETLDQLENADVCPSCGHVGCTGNCRARTSA